MPHKKEIKLLGNDKLDKLEANLKIASSEGTEKFFGGKIKLGAPGISEKEGDKIRNSFLEGRKKKQIF